MRIVSLLGCWIIPEEIPEEIPGRVPVCIFSEMSKKESPFIPLAIQTS
jgi:hypothetical protein